MLAPLLLDRRIAAFMTMDGAKAPAEHYAEERGEAIREWNIGSQYLYETHWVGETSANHSYMVVMIRVLAS
jgi:hypothetical protein